MNFVTSISLVVLGAMFLVLLGWGSIRAAWRNCEGRRGVFAALAILAAVCSIVAQKPSPDTPTITVDALLRDVGCYATNNVFHAAVTNAPSYAGIDFSDCDLMVYARERASSDAASWFELTPRKKFSQQPTDYAIENATNFNYMVYLNYVPPSPGHTNGVFELYGFVIENEAQGEPDQLAAGFINSRAFLAPPTARDYIQDGLVAMWDGIENAGWGIHDPNATTWKDLVGDNDITLVGGVFGDTALICNGTQYGGHNDNVVNAVQIEIVANAKAYKKRCWIASTGQSSSSKYTGFVGWYDRGLCFGAFDTSREVVLGATNSYSFVANTNNTYENGTLVETVSGRADLTPQAARGICIVVGGQKNNPLWCDIYSFRLYNRSLTPEEIQYNYNIDKRRFNLP